MNKITKNNVAEMGMTELILNQVFVRNGEAWHRDFEREIPVLDLIREIYIKHKHPAHASKIDNKTLDEMMFDNLQYGTDSLEGIISMYYTALCGMAEVRAHLEAYEKSGIPLIKKPETIKALLQANGKETQVDMAIEQMSGLSTALLRERRFRHEKARREETHANIISQISHVFILLAQLIVIFDKDDEIQADIDHKIRCLEVSLATAAKNAGQDKAQEVLQSAT